MSDKKISELDLVASNASGDQFPLVQNGGTMKTTLSKIATYLGTIFTTTAEVAAQITAAITGKEDTANKQNNLNTDATNTKYPTVTATNAGLATKLNLSGGTMSGNVNMGQFNITDLSDPSDDNDAATKKYTDTALATKLDLTGGDMLGNINMGGAKVRGIGEPSADEDAATKIYVDGLVSGLEYNLGNTATGTTSVTINATSGVATFTQRLNGKSNAYYEINNTSIAAGDFIECNLFYTGAGFPIIMHYQTISNRIRLHIGNIAVDGGSGTNTNADLVVTFRKI
jgi:hypothetical protein